MHYLLLSILCSSLLSIIMRYSERYSKDSLSMLAMNYVACCALSLIHAGSANIFPTQPGLSTALLLGAFGGVFYLGGFVLLQWNIARNGVVLPTTFMKLGVLVPTLMAILVFGESPRPAQIIGVILTVASILLIQGGGAARENLSLPGLILLLLCGGLANAVAKIYEQVGAAALSDHFLFYNFLMALLLCLALCIARKQRLNRYDLAFGLLIGVPNYYASRFLLLSLSDVPAVVAFPCSSVGAIVLVALAGVLLFHEKLSRRKCAALAVILVALVLLNL